ncbi:tRNA selenocysteine 1-associated protein 1-like [Daphnia pulex]|uniref:tRNA selenocysteine 1-associated protein 1-like n=1 Tax=Daphnia pulex TaxID=6669 RepID=UPI001EDCA470|nr:tRNA selenocysteine 1-associated protein 1-like [Daphnia pulex]XP_046653122.1 tRNA selenocysteine 1-associated protein 1-like [Daphnia pulicaria]
MALERASSLWIGGLEPYMTEEFLMRSFELMGEKPEAIKVMRNKHTGLPAGFGFCQFRDEKQAMEVLHKLNGKIIPYSQPPSRFKLNHSTNTKGSTADHALWVGDLSADVDDYGLYKCFSAKYNSVQLAKVVRGSNGESRGYAFVNFSNESDYKDALTHMQGHRGLGSNPLRVSLAIPRNYNMIPGSSSSTSSTSTLTASIASSIVQAAASGQPVQPQAAAAAAGYGQYVDPAYWQQYGGWQGYGYQGGYGYDGQQAYAGYGVAGQMPAQPEEDEFELIEHNTPVDIEKLNRELFERNQDLWDALDEARWTTFNPEKAVPAVKAEENGSSTPTVVAA